MQRGELPVRAGDVVPVGGGGGGTDVLLNVRLNERSHTFWFVDERFSVPLHWTFVTLGWCELFGAAAAQIVSRLSNLADMILDNAPTSILAPFPSRG